MARNKYTITRSDHWFARRWIEGKLENPTWLGEEATYAAQQTLSGLDYDADQLNGWCEQWFATREWTQMKNAIRAARRRANDPAVKTVTLSQNAWFILSRLAEKEGCTMSEIIERHLGHVPAGGDAPAGHEIVDSGFPPARE
jgi:macrodomain Ter protein organizer (MatP/YcbG family)